MAPKLYIKFTAEDGSPCNGGYGKWGLPRGKRPGRWWEVKGEIEPCLNGLHLCRPKDVLHWLGPAMWVVQADGPVIDAGNKVVVRRARLVLRVPTYNDRTLRLFACDEAERALNLYDNGGDPRSRMAIEVARRYANGEATREELDAAWAAAGAAAWDAAWDAAWAASTKRLAKALSLPRYMTEARKIIAAMEG